MFLVFLLGESWLGQSRIFVDDQRFVITHYTFSYNSDEKE